MTSAAQPQRHTTATKRIRSDILDLQPGEAAERVPVKRSRRGRRPLVDATRIWEAAEIVEAVLGPRLDLVHSARMGWLLRAWNSDLDHAGLPRMHWTEVDSAPEGQLGALLLRHQERMRQTNARP